MTKNSEKSPVLLTSNLSGSDTWIRDHFAGASTVLFIPYAAEGDVDFLIEYKTLGLS